MSPRREECATKNFIGNERNSDPAGGPRSGASTIDASGAFDWDDVGFWTVDLVTGEFFVSTQVFRMIGLDEMSWEVLSEHTHDDDRPMLEHVVERASSTAGPYRLDLRFFVDGHWRTFRHRLQSIAGPEDRPVRIIGAVAELHEVATGSIDMGFVDGDRRVSLLARGMVHDFKNSLAVISGHADLAYQRVRDGDDAPTEHLAVIRRVVAEAVELTTRLLHAGRPADGVVRHVDPRSVLQRIAPLAQATLGRNAHVIVDVDEGETNNWMVVDPHRLDGALIDALINARDAMDPDRRRLELRYVEDDVEPDSAIATHHGLEPGRYGFLSMADNGEGMDAATLEHAIEPLYTTKGAEAGSGLGLAMAVDFARTSGGALLLESESGEGTTVTFVLPTAKRRRRKVALRARRRRVALAGNDVERVAAARRQLEGYCQTVLCRSDVSLERLIRSEPIDVVLEFDRASRPMITMSLCTRFGLSTASTVWSSESLQGLEAHIETITAEPGGPDRQ